MSQRILLLVLLVSTIGTSAQQQSAWTQSGSDQTPLPPLLRKDVQNPVPFVVKFTGKLRGLQGQPSTAPMGITFALYQEENGGVPLWNETQNATVDSQSRFTVLLGSSSGGLSPDVFASGEARWLGITPDGGVEEARVLLASVPYAFIAADAQTISGRTADEFVTQEQLGSYLQHFTPIVHTPIFCSLHPCPSDPISFTTNRFEAFATSGPSFISHANTGPPLQVGSTTLVQNLNVDFLHGFKDSDFAKLNSNNQFTLVQQFNGGSIFPPIPGNGSTPESSSPQDFESMGRSNGNLISQIFRWQVNGSDENQLQPKFSLSFGSDGQMPQPTGLSVNADGTINFAPGQTFPGNTIATTIIPLLTPPVPPGGTRWRSISPTQPGNQVITLPLRTNLNINNHNHGPVQVTVQASDNWLVSNIATTLTAGEQATLTLTPCPRGVDTSGNPILGGPNGGYPIRIIDGTIPNTSESVYVTGGTCKSKASKGTIIFTSHFSHAMSSYKIGSASGGIQEAINDACGTNSVPSKNSGCNVVIPPTGPQVSGYSGFDIYDTIYFHTNGSVLSGYGAILNCHERGPCLQVGDLIYSNDYANNTIEGIAFRSIDNRRSDPAFNGSLIQSTQRTAGVITIQTAAAHNLRTGDRVTQMLTDTVDYWGDVPSIVVTDATHYTYSRAKAGDISFQVTPGVVALSYEAVLDNGGSTSLVDLQYENTYEYGAFNHFFDFWDDENAQIQKFNNNAISLNHNANWTGSFVWSGGAQSLPNISQQLASVITVSNSSITANSSNCATVYNSNGFYVQNSVCQASGPWQFLVSNSTGNYQGAAFQNIYSESAAYLNPTSPARSPWPGLGVAGLIGGPSTGAATFTLSGEGGFSGAMPVVGSGSTTYVYYVVARNATAGTQTSPLPFMYEQENSASNVTVQWPRLAAGTNTIVYDVIRNPAPAGTMNAAAGGYVTPYTGSCNGGSSSACGSVAIGLAQCSGLVCSFADNTANATSPYRVNNGNFMPNPTFWPGAAVLTSTALQSDYEVQVTGIAFNGAPSEYANYCSAYGANVSGGYTVCSGSPTTTNNSVPDQPPLILTDGAPDGGGLPGAKGRLIFESAGNPLNFAFHQIITLYDSNPAKTQSTTGHRPVGDPGDMYLGINPNQYLMIGGGANGIAQYVNNIGDGMNYGELLTSSLKTFNVPIQFRSSLTALAPLIAAKGCVGCSPFTMMGAQVSDNFTYTGALNSNWTVINGTCAVADGNATCIPPAYPQTSVAVYTGSSFSNDQEACAVVLNANPGYAEGVGVRLANTVSSSITGYFYVVGAQSSYIMKSNGSTVPTPIGAILGGVPIGDLVCLSVYGTSLTATDNGITVQSVTDDTITSGYPGMFGYNAGAKLSNFFAGNLSASTNDAINFNGPISVNGTAGFTGTKTAGSCTFTITNGLITNVTGC